jgi:hypothetical protein
MPFSPRYAGDDARLFPIYINGFAQRFERRRRREPASCSASMKSDFTIPRRDRAIPDADRHKRRRCVDAVFSLDRCARAD